MLLALLKNPTIWPALLIPFATRRPVRSPDRAKRDPEYRNTFPHFAIARAYVHRGYDYPPLIAADSQRLWRCRRKR